MTQDRSLSLHKRLNLRKELPNADAQPPTGEGRDLCLHIPSEQSRHQWSHTPTTVVEQMAARMEAICISVDGLVRPTPESLPTLRRLSVKRCLVDFTDWVDSLRRLPESESDLASIAWMVGRVLGDADANQVAIADGDLPLLAADMVAKRVSSLQARERLAALDQFIGAIGAPGHDAAVPRTPMFVDGSICETKPEWDGVGRLLPSDAQEIFGACIGLFQFVWPDAAHEISWQSRRIVPLRLERDGIWRNASCSSAPFSYVATLSETNIIESCEGILHECMHLRLHQIGISALIDDPDQRPTFYHAWRVDPRPSRGVFLAAHAFFNVYLFYLLLRDAGVFVADSSQFQAIANGVRDALESLTKAKVLTSLGAAMSRRMLEGLLH